MKSSSSCDLIPSSPKRARLPKTWPHVVSKGDVAVKIYKNQGNVRGKNFPTFLLSYYARGRRQLHRFVDFAKASEKARRIAEQKERHEYLAGGDTTSGRVRSRRVALLRTGSLASRNFLSTHA